MKERLRMFGQDHDFHLGDEVLIDVDRFSRPTGVWRGEVIFVGERTASGYAAVRAKITDTRLRDRAPGDGGVYFGEEPRGDYTVYPHNTFTARLFQEIAALQEKLATTARDAKIREDGYMRALVALSSGHAQKVAEQAYERGLAEARAEAPKAEPK